MNDLFSLAAARIARDQALVQVDESADQAWKRVALEKVQEVARNHHVLTVDQVQELLKGEEVSTHEGRAMGAVIMQARRNGWIESTGTTVQSKQKHCHANPRTLWRSLIFMS